MRAKTGRRLALAAAVVALATGCASAHGSSQGTGSSISGNAKHVVWRMQVAPTNSAAVGGTLDELASDLNTMTHGVVTLKVYYGSSLQLDPNQMIQLVQKGTVDASFTPNAGVAVPEADIPTLPGLVPASTNATKMEAFRTKVMNGLQSSLAPLFAAKNQVLMGGVLGTPSSLITTKPITSLSQLAGKNIVTISTTAGDLVKSLGAADVTNLTQVDWYTSLQTGVADGIFVNPSTDFGSKVQGVAKNYLTMNIGGGSIYLTINKNDFDALSATNQGEVRAAYAKFLTRYWNFQYQKSYLTDVQKMQKAGVTVRSLSAADQKLVEQHDAAIIAAYEKSATPSEKNVLNKTQSVVKQYSSELG
jgi:TRAP-type C4-dicarboxylate transport system substrate-binding protein